MTATDSEDCPRLGEVYCTRRLDGVRTWDDATRLRAECVRADLSEGRLNNTPFALGPATARAAASAASDVIPRRNIVFSSIEGEV